MLCGAGIASPLLLAACGSHSVPAPISPPAPPPFYVSGGAGSEHGNFESFQESESTGPGGLACSTYVWDRPLDDKTALRVRSRSCQDPKNPQFYLAEELARTVIPLTSSTLFQGPPN